MLTVRQPGHAFLDDPEKRVQSLEVGEIIDRSQHGSIF